MKLAIIILLIGIIGLGAIVVTAIKDAEREQRLAMEGAQ